MNENHPTDTLRAHGSLPALAPPSPLIPHTATPTQAALAELIIPALVKALTSDPAMPLQAWFEHIKRTDHKEFRRWVELALRVPGHTGNQVVNIINAIPRSPLDELPQGFRINS